MGTVAPGRPNWVDLGSPDLDASREFYAELFGWTADVSDDPQFGGYTTFKKDGKAVAGAGGLSSEGQVPTWSTYVATDSADATAAKVEENGGAIARAADGCRVRKAGWRSSPTRAARPSRCGRPAPTPAPSCSTRRVAQLERAGHPRPGRREAVLRRGLRLGSQGHPERGDQVHLVAAAWPPGGRDDAGDRTGRATAAVDGVLRGRGRDATAAAGGGVGRPDRGTATNNPQGRFAVLSDPHGAVFSIIKPA